MIDRLKGLMIWWVERLVLTNRNGCENLEVKVPILHSVAHDTHAKK
jgi:hypothetical protein